MRALIQTPVVKAALVAGLATSLACLPRLALWTGRTHPVWFLWALLLWASFVLWAFVFAWVPQYTNRRVFNSRAPATVWTAATGCGLLGALFFRQVVDPVLLPVAPEDYPSTPGSWVAATFFTLGLGQLFLCFAPVAFFLRLFHTQAPAVLLTLGLGVLVTILKIHSLTAPLPGLVIVELLALRIISGGLSLYFFLKGGVLVVWWWTFLLQVRHVINL